jgi:cystinosin
MDFVMLNTLGFLCYAIFNVCIFFIPSVQQEYRILHQTSEIPVQLNDVVFAVHATAACLVTLAQCFLYEKDDEENLQQIFSGIFGDLADHI